ncbi:DUF2809 domain-containing protein [Mucilaginibacter roseus]|uniref:DUF2809 domain-containing protein n=1 Tax=Mucilaginibacter roseus TaxID=1528868 RepID=A0ABS8U1B6_9SPHI|nr:DUF2809 domain-containing protein [Mucilaginibacter roseus]MCD8739652.1 DUF2809 domain-containing protein [Mucilaginibacter roseus]
MKFSKLYFSLFIILFLVECLIALYIHDAVIRPYFGDLLVVIMIYCFVKAFIAIEPIRAAVGCLIFAYLVEFSQYMNLAERLGLQQSKLAVTVMGYAFSWIDMLAYTLGAAFIVVIEKLRGNTLKTKMV